MDTRRRSLGPASGHVRPSIYTPQVEPHSDPLRIHLTSILLSILILLTPTYKPLTDIVYLKMHLFNHL
jgi:hypothetical protein